MPGRVNTRALVGFASLLTAAIACAAPSAGNAPTAVAQGPSVVFIGPDNNSLIADGATITLAVYAYNSAGVSKVDFMVDDNLIGTQTAPQGQTNTDFTAEQAWTAKSAGGQQTEGHFVDAIAYATDGTKFDDAKIALQVVPASALTTTPGAPGSTPGAASSGTPDNTQANQPQTTAQPDQGNVPTLIFSTPTPAPTGGPTYVIVTSGPTATPTAPPPTLTVKPPYLHVRAGDNALQFPIIATLNPGDKAQIIGRNAARTWWYIQKGQVRGWVIADPNSSTVSGSTTNVPLVASPPTPTPTGA